MGMIRVIALIVLWLSMLVLTSIWVVSKEVTHISLAGGKRGSEMFEIATAIASVYRDRYPEIDFQVYETQGSHENAELLNHGKVDFGIILSDTQGAEGVSALASLITDDYLLFVREDSDINSIEDLRGKHIAIPPGDGGEADAFWYLMNHYGIRKDDIDVQPMQTRPANFAMKLGQVDAIFRISALGSYVNKDLIAMVPNIKILPIEQAEALRIFHPVLRSGEIPTGAFRGHPTLPKQNIPTVIEDTLLASRGDMSPEQANLLTAVLFERRAQLIAESPFAGHVKAIDADSELALPIHEGARRYYDREKPSVLQENSRLIGTLLYVTTLLITAGVALKTRMKRAHQVQIRDYTAQLIAIREDAEDAESVAEVLGPKKRLNKMMDEVVVELDADAISTDEFSRFSFTWRAVERVVQKRERELTSKVSESNQGGNDED